MIRFFILELCKRLFKSKMFFAIQTYSVNIFPKSPPKNYFPSGICYRKGIKEILFISFAFQTEAIRKQHLVTKNKNKVKIFIHASPLARTDRQIVTFIFMHFNDLYCIYTVSFKTLITLCFNVNCVLNFQLLLLFYFCSRLLIFCFETFLS